MKKVAAELAEQVVDGRPWDRPAMAFHAVFDLNAEASTIGRALPRFDLQSRPEGYSRSATG